MKAFKRIILFLFVLSLASPLFGLDNSVYQFDVKTIKGNAVSMKQYAGNVLLIVNTASGCGFTPQFKGLQELYQKYKAQGFFVLGFPSNDFGGQEPKSNKEIKDFCEFNYKVDFPLFSKVSVLGPGKISLFHYLTETAGPEFKREIDWNFEKFLIDRKGRLVNRFKSHIEPTSNEVTERIEMLLSDKGAKK